MSDRMSEYTSNGTYYFHRRANIRKNLYVILISKDFPYNENTDFENYIKYYQFTNFQ